MRTIPVDLRLKHQQIDVGQMFEHNGTTLAMTLPPAMSAAKPNHYVITFSDRTGKTVFTSNDIKNKGGQLLFTLPQSLTALEQICMQVSCYKSRKSKLALIGKSPVAVLLFGKSINTDLAGEIDGTPKSIIEKMISALENGSGSGGGDGNGDGGTDGGSQGRILLTGTPKSPIDLNALTEVNSYVITGDTENAPGIIDEVINYVPGSTCQFDVAVNADMDGQTILQYINIGLMQFSRQMFIVDDAVDASEWTEFNFESGSGEQPINAYGIQNSDGNLQMDRYGSDYMYINVPKLGNLSSLATTAKDNLVSAINEVAGKSPSYDAGSNIKITDNFDKTAQTVHTYYDKPPKQKPGNIVEYVDHRLLYFDGASPAIYSGGFSLYVPLLDSVFHCVHSGPSAILKRSWNETKLSVVDFRANNDTQNMWKIAFNPNETNPAKLKLAGMSKWTGRVYSSTDGVNWDSTSLSQYVGDDIIYDQFRNYFVYTSYSTLHHSADGITWNNYGKPQNGDGYLCATPNYIYFVTRNGQTYRTADVFSPWTLIASVIQTNDTQIIGVKYMPEIDKIVVLREGSAFASGVIFVDGDDLQMPLPPNTVTNRHEVQGTKRALIFTDVQYDPSSDFFVFATCQSESYQAGSPIIGHLPSLTDEMQYIGKTASDDVPEDYRSLVLHEGVVCGLAFQQNARPNSTYSTMELQILPTRSISDALDELYSKLS
ncbi:MAG: hypothetical protein FWF05_09485 [Oscillospiraceae bacterium]|nr:hypothetical protein [Oscillospiraceae bacterium]